MGLRTRDKLEVRRSVVPPRTVQLPPSTLLNTGLRCLSPNSQPQGEQREEVAGASALAAGGGLKDHMLPTAGEPQPQQVLWARRPRWGL